jgi:uncharacterized membrane protein
MDIAIWIAQGLLALSFITVGFSHAFRFDRFASNPRMGWANAVGRQNMRIIGIFELLGGVGVILPAVTGVLPWLTPLAAAGLGSIMALAAVFHFRRGEPIVVNLVQLAIAVFVVIGRTVIAPL